MNSLISLMHREAKHAKHRKATAEQSLSSRMTKMRINPKSWGNQKYVRQFLCFLAALTKHLCKYYPGCILNWTFIRNTIIYFIYNEAETLVKCYSVCLKKPYNLIPFVFLALRDLYVFIRWILQDMFPSICEKSKWSHCGICIGPKHFGEPLLNLKI